MASRVNPTPRSRKLLEEKGYTVERVEQYNSFSGRRKDLFDVGDLIAINGKEILLVQVTTYNNAGSHRKTIRESKLLRLWKKSGGKFILHLWRKKNNRWQCKEEAI